MKHLRAIAREPRHITKESDSNFLAKYGLLSVHQVLLTRSPGFAARHEPSTIGCRVGVACFDAHVIWLQASSVQLQLQAMQPQAHPRARLVAVPEDVVIYKCQHCGMCFNNLHQVKTHEGRAHGARAPTQIFDATQRDSYSLHGLPQCRFCMQKFTRWRNLQRHIHRNGCPALRSNDKSALGLTVLPEAVPLPALPLGDSAHSKWKSVATVEADGQLPLCRWSSVRACAASKSWQAFLSLPEISAHAKQHCAVCNQWIAQPNGMRKHYRTMHAEYWAKWFPAAQAEAKLWSKVAVSPCSICGASVKDARQHAGQCIVMLQLVMMHHSISGTGRQSRGGNAGFFRQSTAGVHGATQEPAERPIPGAGRPAQICKAASKGGLSEGQGSSEFSGSRLRHSGAAHQCGGNEDPGHARATTGRHLGEDGDRHGLLPADGVSSGGGHCADHGTGRRRMAQKEASQSSVHHFFATYASAGVHDPGAGESSLSHVSVSGHSEGGCDRRPSYGGRGVAVPALGSGSGQACALDQATDASCSHDGSSAPHQGCHNGGECAEISVHPASDYHVSRGAALALDGHFRSPAGGGHVFCLPGPCGQRGAGPDCNPSPAGAKSSKSADGQTWLSQQHP